MAEEKYIDFQCPHCGAELAFQESYAGMAQSCADCQEPLIVPRENADYGGKMPSGIQTARLLLRRFKHTDWKDLLEIVSNEELTRHIDWNLLDEEGVVHWIESDRGQRFTQPGQSLAMGIELMESHKLIGFVTFSFNDELHRQGGLFIMMNAKYQRQGFGSEAVTALVDFCFRGLNLHRITANCEHPNQAAVSLYAKMLRKEGEFQQDTYRNGQWVNTIWYALLRDEYAAWPEEKKQSKFLAAAAES